MSCWALWHNLLDYLSSMLQKYFLRVMCTPCCSWVLDAVVPFVGGVNPSDCVIIKVNLDHHLRHCAGVFPQGSVVPSRVWCLPESLFGCAAWVASWVELFCGLKLTTGCVGSGSIWAVFRYRSLSDVECDWPWATCLELLCCSLFMAAFTPPGCIWEIPICV